MLSQIATGDIYWNLCVATALCLVGYLLGRQRRLRESQGCPSHVAERIRTAAESLLKVAGRLEGRIHQHQSRINRFQKAVNGADRLYLKEVERILAISQQLTADLGAAHTDIAEQLNQLRSLSESRADPLTAIPNRRAFDEELRNQLQQLRKTARSFALVLVDIDHFKHINDTYGHLVGDKVLQSVTETMAGHIRHMDFIARMGGEEFAILMPESDLKQATHAIERVRTVIETVPIVVEGRTVQITVSTGIAAPRPKESAESLLDRADRALYQAKEQGRNRTCFHDGEAINAVQPPNHTPRSGLLTLRQKVNGPS